MSAVKEIIIWAKGVLSSLDNPMLESEVLLCAVLDQKRVWLKAHGEYELSAEEKSRFEDFVAQRAARVPVAYILGYKDWMGMRLKVNESVLIPRDETEVLCDYILEDLRNKNHESVKILDLGTGSGAIACALAQGLGENGRDFDIQGLDISTQALSVAEENAKNLLLSTKFVRSDMLSSIESGDSYDVIVANLPYVPDDLSVSLEVGKEPEMALFSGEDGLNHYRRLASDLKTKNIRVASLWLEFLPQQKECIREIFSDRVVTFLTDSGSDVFFARIT